MLQFSSFLLGTLLSCLHPMDMRKIAVEIVNPLDIRVRMNLSLLSPNLMLSLSFSMRIKGILLD